ncbi:unnamed protein product, partial [Ectocarpus fasciculatus]
MAGEPVSCPICMCSVVRPTVTKCAHLFCRECISRELQRTPAFGMVQLPQAKCPICRRTMKGSEMMELQTLSEVEEAMAIDAPSTAENNRGDTGAVAAEGGATEASEGGGSSSSSSSSSSGSGNGKGKKKARREVEGFEDEKEEEAEEAISGDDHSHGTNAAEASASASNGTSASAAAPSDPAAATCGGGSSCGSSCGSSGGGALSSSVSAAASSSGRSAVDPTSTSSRGPGEGSAGDPSSAAGGASAAGAGSGAGSGGVVAGAAPAPAGDEDGVAGPSLVIPTFRFTPTATASFLSQYRAATSSQSSVKLDALVRDLDTTLLHDPAAKFVIFSQYPQV